MKDWTFICEVCGSTIEYDYSPFDDDNNRVYKTTCCNKAMSRANYNKLVNISMGEHERFSTSMGCLPHEVPRMMKAYPGSEYVVKDGMAQLKIKNRTHKKYEMKRRGYAELD